MELWLTDPELEIPFKGASVQTGDLLSAANGLFICGCWPTYWNKKPLSCGPALGNFSIPCETMLCTLPLVHVSINQKIYKS